MRRLSRLSPQSNALFWTSSLPEVFMANTSAAGNSYRSARRSTRRDQAIQVTVSGVDSRRGPYIEKVSTLTISCHGCKYPSKYQVLPDAWVTLELVPEKTDAPKISARGRVEVGEARRRIQRAFLHRRRIRKPLQHLENRFAARRLAAIRPGAQARPRTREAQAGRGAATESRRRQREIGTREARGYHQRTICSPRRRFPLLRTAIAPSAT